MPSCSGPGGPATCSPGRSSPPLRPEDSLLDLGGIGTARGQEHYALLFLGIAEAIGPYGFGIRVVPPAAV